MKVSHRREVCAGLGTHPQPPPAAAGANRHGTPFQGVLAPSSFWVIRGTLGFTFPPLRAQFSTLGMPKIQAQYLQRENNPGCCGEEPRTSAQHQAGATRGTPLHILQSTPSPALRCWAARGSPGAKEVSLAPTRWQNPLRGEP